MKMKALYFLKSRTDYPSDSSSSGYSSGSSGPCGSPGGLSDSSSSCGGGGGDDDDQRLGVVLAYARATDDPALNVHAKAFTTRLGRETFHYRDVNMAMHCYNLNGFRAIALTEKDYPPWSAYSVLIKELDGYQNRVAESWKKTKDDATEPCSFLNDALSKYQNPVEADKLLEIEIMTCNEDIKKSMVLVTINYLEGKRYAGGIIIGGGHGYALIITDRRWVKSGVEVTVTFEGGEVWQTSDLTDETKWFISDHVIGIRCAVHHTNAIRRIKICKRPLAMSERIFVFNRVLDALTRGRVTRFFGNHFAHNCGVCEGAEYGAAVINKAAELVGMCQSLDYHLTAIHISALMEEIETFFSIASKSVGSLTLVFKM